jgi:uncharacterized protein (TIGR02300 family)
MCHARAHLEISTKETSMPKPEWGTKRTCPNCETRFYDLRREPILCPECGATFNMDDHGKVSGMRERRAPVAVADEADALVDDEEALVDDEEGDEAAEDPLLADDEEDEEPAGPTLADEDDDQAAVQFKDDPLLEEEDEDDEIDEDDDDEEDDLEELDEAPGKKKGD